MPGTVAPTQRGLQASVRNGGQLGLVESALLTPPSCWAALSVNPLGLSWSWCSTYSPRPAKHAAAFTQILPFSVPLCNPSVLSLANPRTRLAPHVDLCDLVRVPPAPPPQPKSKVQTYSSTVFCISHAILTTEVEKNTKNIFLYSQCFTEAVLLSVTLKIFLWSFPFVLAKPLESSVNNNNTRVVINLRFSYPEFPGWQHERCQWVKVNLVNKSWLVRITINYWRNYYWCDASVFTLCSNFESASVKTESCLKGFMTRKISSL